MAIDFKSIQFTGDAKDMRELYEVYRVENYLATYEENSRKQESGLRERLLKDGIRLTEQLSPRIFHLFQEVQEVVGDESTPDIICLPSESINAFAVKDPQKEKTFSIIGITSGALEKLEDNEVKYILGHEMGHFVFNHNRFQALLSNNRESSSLTVLPPLGESLFLRWQKKTEISADRIGLLSCGDFYEATKALVKATFGLSARNLNLDIDALLSQIDDIKDHPEVMSATFASHPLLPIRLKALELFSKSDKAYRNGLKLENEDRIDDKKLENDIENLMNLTRRYPHKDIQIAIMKTIALGGALMLGSDGDISDEEVKILIQCLHCYFTDNPEKEILTDIEQIKNKLNEILPKVKSEANSSDKIFTLSRLADIALADGAILDSEGGLILKIAEDIGIPANEAYKVIIGAAQTVGFKTDVKLNRIAEKLRSSMSDALTRILRK